MSSFRVNSPALNLRSKPVVAPATKIAVLGYSQIVERIEAVEGSIWWRVSATINGIVVNGFVNSSFLTPFDEFIEPESSHEIGPVHLSTNKLISRAVPSGQAFPLSEANQPRRSAAAGIQKVEELHKIINWLKVDQSLRYLPKAGATYCNIYAYDYCYLANVYLPRVWWTSKAISMLTGGTSVSPIYAKTVSELNANSLHNWFSEYGNEFDWRQTFDLTELQESANSGSVCIMSARRKDLNKSGHICAVVPETDDHKAVRKNGSVTTPVQSQAGATNFRYGGKIWWTSVNFSSFSFWIHD